MLVWFRHRYVRSDPGGGWSMVLYQYSHSVESWAISFSLFRLPIPTRPLARSVPFSMRTACGDKEFTSITCITGQFFFVKLVLLIMLSYLFKGQKRQHFRGVHLIELI